MPSVRFDVRFRISYRKDCDFSFQYHSDSTKSIKYITLYPASTISPLSIWSKVKCGYLIKTKKHLKKYNFKDNYISQPEWCIIGFQCSIQSSCNFCSINCKTNSNKPYWHRAMLSAWRIIFQYSVRKVVKHIKKNKMCIEQICGWKIADKQMK